MHTLPSCGAVTWTRGSRCSPSPFMYSRTCFGSPVIAGSNGQAQYFSSERLSFEGVPMVVVSRSLRKLSSALELLTENTARSSSVNAFPLRDMRCQRQQR